MKRARALAAACCLALPTVVRPAQAAEPTARTSPRAASRVAVLQIESDPQLVMRIVAELRAEGLEPVEVTTIASNEAQPFDALLAGMRGVDAGLALCVAVQRERVRLWIANATTGKRVYREMATPAERAIIALWAVEALRASGIAAPPSAEPPPRARPVERRPPPRAFQLGLGLGPAMTLSPGGLDPSAHLLLSARALWARRLGGEALALVPTWPSELERSAGGASIARGMFALGPSLAADVSPVVAVDVAAGAVLVLQRVSGTPSAGYSAQSEWGAAYGPYARVGAGLALSRALRLRADAASGVAFPRSSIWFGDQQVAVWGRPWFLTSLAAQVVF